MVTRRYLEKSSIGVLIIFCFLGFAAASLPAQDISRSSSSFDIAYTYFKKAAVLLNEDRLEAAARLLDVSLEFYPDFSESAYLYARLYMKRQETSFKARRYLETALAADNWTDTEPLQAKTELARLLVRTGRFQEAWRLIGEGEGGTTQKGLGGRGNPDLSQLWARTLIGLGRVGAAESFLREAVRRFPRSPELTILLSGLLQDRGRLREAGVLLERAVQEMPSSTELLYERASVERDAARRLAYLDRYFELGGSDPGAALLAMSSDPENSQRYLESFYSLGGNQRIDYVDALGEYLYSKPEGEFREGKERFLANLLTYTGSRNLDENNDGYHEELYQYTGGELVHWLLDRDQDGLSELEVGFSAGIPDNLTATAGQQRVEFHYSDYPYVEAVRFFEGGDRREYLLVPYQLSQAVFSNFPQRPISGAGGKPPPLRLQVREDIMTDEGFFRRLSYRMAEFPAQSDLTSNPLPDRLVHYLNGRIIRIDENPDPRGRFTHTVHYSGSLPVEGRRDLNGDGYFEIREEYAGGVLRKIALDEDGNGVQEYVQIIESGASTKYWDYDEDGLFDSREYTGPSGAAVREFSSRLDGSFDLTYTGELK